MLVEDLQLLIGSFRSQSYALFQDQRNRVEFQLAKLSLSVSELNFWLDEIPLKLRQFKLIYYFDLDFYFYLKKKQAKVFNKYQLSTKGLFLASRGGQLPPLDPPWLRPVSSRRWVPFSQEYSAKGITNVGKKKTSKFGGRETREQ